MDFYKNLKLGDRVVVCQVSQYSIHIVIKKMKSYVMTQSVETLHKYRFNMKGDIYGSSKGNSIFLTPMSEEDYNKMFKEKLLEKEISSLKTELIIALSEIKANYPSVKNRLENMLRQLKELKDIVNEHI